MTARFLRQESWITKYVDHHSPASLVSDVCSVLLIAVLLAACGNTQPVNSLTPQPVPSQALAGTATTAAPTEAAVLLPTATPPTVTQPVPTVQASAGAPITSASIANLTTVAVLGRGVPYAIALNDERSMLAAGGTAGVWLYDYPTLDPVRRLASDAPWINAVAWSPDSQRVAGYGVMPQQDSDTVWIWDAATGNVLRVLEDSPDMGRALAWSPDGKKLAAAGSGAVRVWDTGTGDVLRTFEGLGLPFIAIAWSPDSTLLAATETVGSHRVYLWDLTGHAQERILELSSSEGTLGSGGYSLDWSPDGKYLAAGRLEDVTVWDTSTWTSLPVPGTSGSSGALAWSPDGQKLAWGNEGGKVSVLRLEDGEWAAQTLGWHRGIVSSLVWLSDSDVLLSGSYGFVGKHDGALKTWDIAEAKEVSSTQLVDHMPVWTMGWSPDGGALTAVESNGAVWLWDVAAGTEIGQWLDAVGRVTSFAWSPDGSMMATGNNQGQIQLWNARTHEVAARLDAGTDPIAAVVWSPNGQTLATWAADGRLRLWDTATASERAAVYAGVPVGWHGLAWSPDGSSLALGSDAGILILDAQTGESTGKLTDGDYKVGPVAWSSDGLHVVSGDSDGAIRVWNVGNRQLEQTVPGPSGGAVDLAWSPAGDLLAAAGAFGSLSVLRTDTWHEVASWIRLPLGLNSVEWSPDGDLLVWGGSGGILFVMGVSGAV